MNVRRECITCILNQIIRVSDYLNLNEKDKDAILQKALERAAKYDYKHLSPPEFSEFLYDIVIEKTGQTDPYKDLKQEQNDLVMNNPYSFEEKIFNSMNPLKKAAKYALAGNIIDYGGVQTFDIDFKELDKIKVDIDDFSEFSRELKTAKTILYIADNAGEAVFDKFFITQIKEFFKEIKIFYAVKSKPAINDVVKYDAEYIGIDKVAKIVESGMGMAGTVMEKTTDEFKRLFDTSDIVISKGQGNFETLDVERRKILFIFKVKCKIVSNYSGIKLGSNIFAYNTNLNLTDKS
jgi:uncharacterized protein with ATP-grasp and redox domains